MKLAHISDLHFGANEAGVLSWAAQSIRDQSVEAVIASGDITQSGRQEEFRAAAAWFESLGVPVLPVPGNHDTPVFNLLERFTRPWAHFKTHLGDWKSGVRLGNVEIFRLNTGRAWQARLNWAEGAVSANTLRGLFGSHDPNVRRILVCHHPLVRPPGTLMSCHTHGGKAAVRIAAENGVALVLSGHVHTPSTQIMAHGEYRYLAVTAGTLSSRLRGQAPGFNILSISGAGIKVAQQSYPDVTGRFGNATVWTFGSEELSALEGVV